MDTKSFLTQEAFKLFLEKGYKDTSLSDIIKATQISKGGIYHYFKNKESMYIEVIDTYFLSYFKQIDFDEMEQMNMNEIEEVLKNFFSSFTPQTIQITDKGVSRHFILFFEAFEYHPTFREDIRSFYSRLKNVLSQKLKNEKKGNYEIVALSIIAKYEGLLFWQSVFPEEKISDLLKAI